MNGTGLPAPSGLGELTPDELATSLQPLWEGLAPWLAVRIAGRTFATWAQVIDACAIELASATDDELAALVALHPRLGGDRDALHRRSSTSFAEQAAGGGPSAEVLAAIAERNETYERRFGFPFVVWVAGRPLADIVAVFDERLGRDQQTELGAARHALVAIARDRLARLGG